MHNAVMLSYLAPNGYGHLRCFRYSGDLEAVSPVERQSRIHGWLIESWTSSRRKSRFVFYGDGGSVWLHAPGCLVCCSDGSATITYRKFLYWLFVTIRRPHVLAVRYRILIPPLRYVFNDGMFPDEVEPLYEILRRLDKPDEHARLRRLLNDGISLEGIPDSPTVSRGDHERHA
jgi:hypothetical protein